MHTPPVSHAIPQPHPLSRAWAARPPRPLKLRGKIIPFALLHMAALVTPWVVPPTWELVALAAGLYVVRMFGITAGYHRYFAHRSFRTSRAGQFALAWLAQSSAQKGVLWWAAHHRNHHRFSDTDQDVHSPVRTGLWWSHVGWIMDDAHDAVPEGRINDFTRFPELRWLDRRWWVPPAVLALGLFAAGGVPALAWGFALSTVVLFHGTFTINSLSHVFGRRRFATRDTSRNNPLLALITLGEGWHNNHHHYCSSANQGFYWWELDVTYLCIRVLAALGLAWDVRTPPARVLEEGRRADTARKTRPAPSGVEDAGAVPVVAGLAADR